MEFALACEDQKVACGSPVRSHPAKGLPLKVMNAIGIHTASQIGLTTQPKRKNLPFLPLQIATLKSGAF
jgi:hypothetical protein